jgi:hypothetical protein
MNITRLLAASLALLVAGCAHPIDVAPNLAKLDRSSIADTRIPARVGYYIPASASSLEVTTPGGGGDNVRYFPYRDIEDGFKKMLSNVFEGVSRLTSIGDTSDAARDGIDFIVVPEVVTNSSSESFITWTPMSFSVDLTSSIRDKVGKLITTLRVVGTGRATEYGERLSDKGIAGRRAMEDALMKMQESFMEAKVLRAKPDARPTQQRPPPVAGPAAARLSELKELMEKGLISREEYEAKRKAILESL